MRRRFFQPVRDGRGLIFEHRLAIELDGGIHSQPSQIRRDSAKEAYIARLGIRVLRIANGMVLRDPEAFEAKVREAMQ